MADKTIDIDINANAFKLKELKKSLDDVKKIAEETSDVDVFKDANKQADNLNKSILELNKSMKGTAATFEEVNGEMIPMTTRIGEMEDRMYELAAAGQANSDEFKKLQKDASDMRKTIIEVDMAVDDMASNRGLASFGTNIKDIGASLLTLDFARADKQAKALAISAKGIKFGDAIKSVKSLGSTLMNLGKALLTNPLFLIAAVIITIGVVIYKLMKEIGLLKVVMKALGKVFDFVMIPIRALIQGLKNLTDWLGWTDNAAAESAEKHAESAEKRAQAYEAAAKRITQSLNTEIRLAEINGENTEELEREKLEFLKQTAIERKKADKAAYESAKFNDDLTLEEKKDIKQKAIDSKLAARQAIDDIKIFNAEVLKASKDLKEDQKELDEKAAQEKRDKEEADRKDSIARWKTYRDNRLSAERAIQKLELDLLEDGVEKESAINKANFENQIEDVKKNEKLKADEKAILIDLLTKQQAAKEKELRDKQLEEDKKNQAEADKALIELQDAQFALQQELTQSEKEKEIADLVASYEDKFALAVGNAELELELQTKLNEDVAAIEKDYRDKKTAAEKEAADLRADLREKEKAEKIKDAQEGLDLVIQGINAIQGLGDAVFKKKMKGLEEGSKAEEEAARKQFKFNKALQLGGAVIDASKAVLSSLASSPVAIGPVPNPAGIASLAFVAASSVANIAQIAATQFEGTGAKAPEKTKPSISGGASGASQAVPSFDFFGNGDGTANNVGGTQSVEAGGQGQPILQVSVVEITDAQSKLAKIQESGTL